MWKDSEAKPARPTGALTRIGPAERSKRQNAAASAGSSQGKRRSSGPARGSGAVVPAGAELGQARESVVRSDDRDEQHHGEMDQRRRRGDSRDEQRRAAQTRGQAHAQLSRSIVGTLDFSMPPALAASGVS